MNITSILITIVGIIIIIALYLMSRITQSKLPKKHTTLLPELKDADGNKFTSILDDIPARDGMTPSPAKKPDADVNNGARDSNKNKSGDNTSQQIILFISTIDGQTLDGNQVKKALLKNGLQIGDRDIYHYYINGADNSNSVSKNQLSSLFRVANGVEPWTLTDLDLIDKQIAGLSLVMLVSDEISDKKAVKTFINVAERLANDVKGILKNQQQQVLSKKDKELLIPQ